MMLFSLAGVAMIGKVNDLIWLFIALELVSIPTYILVAHRPLADRSPRKRASNISSSAPWPRPSSSSDSPTFTAPPARRALPISNSWF